MDGCCTPMSWWFRSCLGLAAGQDKVGGIGDVDGGVGVPGLYYIHVRKKVLIMPYSCVS